MKRLVPIVAIALSSAALAQQEYRLDDKGQWQPAAAAAPRSPDEETIARARQALADDKPSLAASILDDWIEKNQSTQSPLLPQAYLIRGDARTARGDEYNALYDYEELALNYAGTEEFSRAIARELDIALRYLNGLHKRWLGLRIVPAYDIGEELLVRVQERMPGTALAERACIELADYYYRQRDLMAASDAYEIYTTNFPKGPHIDNARLRRIYASIGRYKGPNYDTAGLVDARVLIEDYANRDPEGARSAGLTDALLAKIDESQAAQLMERSAWYLKRSDPVSARACLRRVVERFPTTLSARDALRLMKERGWSTSDGAGGAPPDAPSSTEHPTTDRPTNERTPVERKP